MNILKLVLVAIFILGASLAQPAFADDRLSVLEYEPSKHDTAAVIVPGTPVFIMAMSAARNNGMTLKTFYKLNPQWEPLKQVTATKRFTLGVFKA